MKASILFIAAVLCCTGCKKIADVIVDKATTIKPGQFTKFTIRSGQQYCDGNVYKTIDTDKLDFVVRFDSSAIYQNQSPENQYDINKLFGFSDNGMDHHQFSARFGWRWSEGALRLFAYVYNEGKLISKELTQVKIGEEIRCSITAGAGTYTFSAGDVQYRMPRSSVTEKARGYQLYPYFGGDETAPHDIHIWIKLVE